MKKILLPMLGALIFSALSCKPELRKEVDSEEKAFGLGNPKPFVFEEINYEIYLDSESPTKCPTNDWKNGRVWQPKIVQLCMTEDRCQEFAAGKSFNGKNVKEEFRRNEWCYLKCNPDDFSFTGMMAAVNGNGQVDKTRPCTQTIRGKALEGTCTDIVDKKLCIITPRRK